MVWSCTEIQSSAISDLVVGGVNEGQAEVLMVINKFYQCPVSFAKTRTEPEVACMVHRLYLIHLANLYGAGNLMPLLYPYVRTGPYSESARAGLESWAKADAARARCVAHHCAQMLALARIYANNSPWEPFVIFHAGVVLSCIAELLPHTSSAACPTGFVRLDALGGDESQHSQISTWIRDGGHVNVGLYGVPSLCCSRGRRQVLDQTTELLKRRRVWCIARNFTRVVLSLRNSVTAEQEPSSPGGP